MSNYSNRCLKCCKVTRAGKAAVPFLGGLCLRHFFLSPISGSQSLHAPIEIGSVRLKPPSGLRHISSSPMHGALDEGSFVVIQALSEGSGIPFLVLGCGAWARCGGWEELGDLRLTNRPSCAQNGQPFQDVHEFPDIPGPGIPGEGLHPARGDVGDRKAFPFPEALKGVGDK